MGQSLRVLRVKSLFTPDGKRQLSQHCLLQTLATRAAKFELESVPAFSQPFNNVIELRFLR